MGKTVTVECEVDIDDYVNEISDSILFEEVSFRLENSSDSKINDIAELLLSENDDLLITMLSRVKKLNLIESMKLSNFIKNL